MKGTGGLAGAGAAALELLSGAETMAAASAALTAARRTRPTMPSGCSTAG